MLHTMLLLVGAVLLTWEREVGWEIGKLVLSATVAQEWDFWACTFLLVAETSYRYNFMCRMNGDEASISQDRSQLVVCNDVM